MLFQSDPPRRAVSTEENALKRLSGKRILIVGASSGIGRAIAVAVGQEGARVAVAARRGEVLREVAASVPGGAAVAPCDVRDEASTARAVGDAVAALGGLDALVYATGRARLVDAADATAADWAEILETNLVGASIVTRAALPHLKQSRGRALFLSSISADDHPPRRGLGLYLVSKAALNRLVDVWQAENRDIGFTRVSVGDTGATDFAAEWNMEAGGEYVREWISRGYLFGRAMDPAAVARHVVDLLATDEAIPQSTLVPRFPESQ